jgi:galactose mutarotase-like enzyme
MDIGAAEFMGKPLPWLHPALGTPEQFEPQGLGWLRTFGGGLVTTCGLTHVGGPEDEGREHFGLHGRISHIPAENLRVWQEWRGEDYVLAIEGQTRQTVLFGENLLLTRKISTRLGANALVIEDTVRNDGFRATPLMILYHCNFGFPVVSADSELVIDDDSVEPRDDAARVGLSAHTRFDPPAPGYAEQVFFHHPRAGADGFAQAALVNRALNFGAYVKWRVAELPIMWQWKMMGARDYICGLEPTNHPGLSRQKMHEQGKMQMLEPGEEMRFHVELGTV